jgi:hypothetical protein
MTQVCGLLDQGRTELIADLQQFYNINIEDVWSGKVSAAHVLDLVSGLWDEPWSRFRARVLRDHPPTAPETSTAPSWLGWTPEVSRLTTIVDLVVTALSGKQKPKPSPRPETKAAPMSIREAAAAFERLSRR